MEEVDLKELDSRLYKQVENVRRALDKNPSYSVDVMSNIVDRHPECLEARKLLRKAQQKANLGKSKAIKSMFSKVSCALSGIGSDEKVRKNPTAALSAAEKLLNSNPSNTRAHKAIGIASESLKLYKTAAFAYEEIQKIQPENLENAKALMTVYMRIGKNEEAVRIGDQAYQKNPSDNEIQTLIRKASVEQSIRKGKWEEGKSFRDNLKDKEEAHRLEQANKAKTGDDELRSMIEAAKQAVAEQPDNLNLYRDIFNGHRKLKEFGKALEWIALARKLKSGSTDVSLEQIESQLRIEQIQQKIAAKKEELKSDPNNANLQSKLKSLQAEEDTFRFVQAKAFVKRYPTEFSYRYELGDLYYRKGELDAAIKELQLAQRSSKVRVNAITLLGKIYKSKRFFDLAIEQFNTVKSEISELNEQKKEVLYELGSCYELQGGMEKAIKEYKTLYSVDISYRDVSKKIDDFYAQ